MELSLKTKKELTKKVAKRYQTAKKRKNPKSSTNSLKTQVTIAPMLPTF
jgi:hypothetical protein